MLFPVALPSSSMSRSRWRQKNSGSSWGRTPALTSWVSPSMALWEITKFKVQLKWLLLQSSPVFTQWQKAGVTKSWAGLPTVQFLITYQKLDGGNETIENQLFNIKVILA